MKTTLTLLSIIALTASAQLPASKEVRLVTNTVPVIALVNGQPKHAVAEQVLQITTIQIIEAISLRTNLVNLFTNNAVPPLLSQTNQPPRARPEKKTK